MYSRVHKQLQSMFTKMPIFDSKFRSILENVNNEENISLLQKIRQNDKDNYIKNTPISNKTVSVYDRYIPSLSDENSIRVRIYEPSEKNKVLPAILWIHGGGYFTGCPEVDDTLCHRFVSDIECLVVSVDYRLAPENPFPIPLEDCYSALVWCHNKASKLKIDSTRIAVAGASAGGGLTAALSLLARDRKGPNIAFQMPLYPMIDDRCNTQSSHEINDRRVWNTYINQLAWSAYLQNKSETEISPYAAPSRSKDVSNLPPTYTCVGDLDPFRDETIEYVAKLTRAGVPTEFHLYPGCFHGFEIIADTEICQLAITQYTDALKRALIK